ELDEQVLPDGGHFERSPYYHVRMTALVKDVIDLLAAAGSDVPPALSRAAEKMEAFHRALRHQDGSLPLFHDGLGTSDPVPPAAAPLSFPASGYYILEGPQGRLIADYGAPGSCYNPGHQHAGIFSFEISSGPRRVVVDTGTPTYEPGPERDRLRSTAAHNTVRVGGRDQFEVWSGFRVGRRAWVRDAQERREQKFELLSAAHDGYRRLGVEHRRTIVSVPGAGWLIVDDLTGRGSHRLESFLHLGPGVTPELSDGRACLLPLGWTLLPFGLAAPPERIFDTYSPAAGLREPSETLILRAGPELPCRFGYWLGPFPAVRLIWDGPHLVRLETSDGDSIEVGYN
ncbi:MAG: alginate lyase family protein, partial [Acidobacteria bacterium]|nr:alginate lyase family protein [Acidobacteriota bacterium]